MPQVRILSSRPANSQARSAFQLLACFCFPELPDCGTLAYESSSPCYALARRNRVRFKNCGRFSRSVEFFAVSFWLFGILGYNPSSDCGRSSMVEPEPSKLLTRVRFPSPAPFPLLPQQQMISLHGFASAAWRESSREAVGCEKSRSASGPQAPSCRRVRRYAMMSSDS